MPILLTVSFFVLYFLVRMHADVPSRSISISATCISPRSEDDIELYRNITSIYQRFLAFCFLFYRHDAIIWYLIYSVFIRIWLDSINLKVQFMFSNITFSLTTTSQGLSTIKGTCGLEYYTYH